MIQEVNTGPTPDCHCRSVCVLVCSIMCVCVCMKKKGCVWMEGYKCAVALPCPSLGKRSSVFHRHRYDVHHIMVTDIDCLH